MEITSQLEQGSGSESDAPPCCLSSSEGEKTWYAANKEKAKAAAKAWYVANKEKAKAAALKRYHEHKERAAGRMKQWRAEKREHVLAEKRRWNKENREKVKEMEKRHREKDPERFRKKICERANNRTAELKDSYIKQLLIQHTDLKKSQIPQELVDLKRKHLKIHRQLKQNEQ